MFVFLYADLGILSVVGSKIRASVAHTSFDEFHRNSAQVIQYAVFGKPSAESPSTTLKFEANNLVSKDEEMDI